MTVDGERDEAIMRKRLEDHYAAKAYLLSAWAEDLRVMGRTVKYLTAEGVERELQRVRDTERS